MRKILLISGVSALSFAAGYISGYYFAKKKLENYFDEQVDAEVSAAVNFDRYHRKQKFETPADAVEHLIPEGTRKALNSYQGKDVTAEDIREEHQRREEEGLLQEVIKGLEEADADKPVTRNIFSDPRSPLIPDDAEEVQEGEEGKEDERNPEHPYLISVDEFLENPNDYIQVSYTYYAGDKTLTGDRPDEVINEVDITVGLNNLERFGYVKNDPEMIFVRNEKLSLDIEVSRSHGKYSVEVGGFDDRESPPQG